MQSAILCKLRSRSGQSLLELALILPILVVLILGVVDLSRAINIHNSLVNMSREGANLASRSMLMQQEEGPQLIMNSLANTAGALSMQTNGAMYITQVNSSGGAPTIKSQVPWQRNVNAPPSAVAAGTLPNVLGSIKVSEGDTIWIFEVFYRYQSLFAESYSPQLHTLAIFSGGSR